ncbi:type IV secretory system conjugative DNA transfer family protein [Deinococcus koreensis]|nr:type IV secretory system conjugative DNA transfer family protein [Deinococcus koreensis]
MIIHYHYFLLRLLSFYVAVALGLYAALGGGLIWLAPALTALVVGLWFFDGRDARFRSMYTAHWARPHEIGDAMVKQLRGDEVLLGYAYDGVVGLRAGLAGRKELGHVLFVGPTRAGKGLNATANLLNWRGSVVVVDIKGEFYNLTAGYRRQVMGQDVYVLNPSTGAPTNQFDPFAERDTPEQLQATAEAILNPDGDGSNKAFALRASFILTAAMMVAKEKGVPVLPFIRECLAMGCERASLMLEQESQNPEVHRNLSFFVGMKPSEYHWDGFGHDKFLNNSWINLIAKMKYLVSQGIIDMTSGSDFRATDLLKKRTSLYMVFRESDLRYTVHSFGAVILAVVESIIRQYDMEPGGEFVPIMFIFDEAGRLAVPMLDELISTVAGRGMIALVYVQALSQLDKVYGEDGADTVKSGTHTKVFYTPKDLATAKYISESCGRYMFGDHRTSENADSGRSDTTGLNSRELITPDEVLEVPLGNVLIKSNEFPMIAGYRMEPFTLPQAKVARTMRPPPVERRPLPPPVPAPERVQAAPVPEPELVTVGEEDADPQAPTRRPVSAALGLNDAPVVEAPVDVDLENDRPVSPAPQVAVDDLADDIAAFERAIRRP